MNIIPTNSPSSLHKYNDSSLSENEKEITSIIIKFPKSITIDKVTMMTDKYGTNKVFVVSAEKYIYNIIYDYLNDAQNALHFFNDMYANCAHIEREVRLE